MKLVHWQGISLLIEFVDFWRFRWRVFILPLKDSAIWQMFGQCNSVRAAYYIQPVFFLALIYAL